MRVTIQVSSEHGEVALEAILHILEQLQGISSIKPVRAHRCFLVECTSHNAIEGARVAMQEMGYVFTLVTETWTGS